MKRRWWMIAPLVAMATGLPGPEVGPRLTREDLEWLDVRIPESNNHGLPRVLLVGDSIARDYWPHVVKALRGRATVGLLATSKGVGDPALLLEVALVLGQTRFDVVHFNNGLHGLGHTEEEYRAAFPRLIDAIRDRRQATPN